jgi:hypothetical protein
MSILQPVVRTMVLCERVSWDLDRKTYTLDNPMYRVRTPAGQLFPAIYPGLWAYVQLSDALGTFEYAIQVVYDLGRGVVARTRPFRLGFGADQRLTVRERSIKIDPFPVRRPGLYGLEFLCNGVAIAEAPLHVEASS